MIFISLLWRFILQEFEGLNRLEIGDRMADEQGDIVVGKKEAIVVGVMWLLAAENDAIANVDETVLVDSVIIWLQN